MLATNLEQRTLEARLDEALKEAREKVNSAFQSATSTVKEHQKEVWAAAESLEYVSLLYIITYNLEGSAMERFTHTKEQAELGTILKEASQLIEEVQIKRSKGDRASIIEAYKIVQKAANSLRLAYLSLTKRSSEV